jgi:hypothetical protein
MRKLLMIAGVAALTIPGLANAQTTCHHEKNNDRVVGTVVGAGLGALLGSAIAGHHDRGVGAVAGAVGGGVVGNAVGGSAVHCDRYDNGYYDRDGYWHTANGRGSGYYDRDGRWVGATASNGYYDRYGRWVGAAPDAGRYGADVSYTGGNLYARENDLEQQIRSAQYNGRLSSYDANRLYRQLNGIRSRQTRLSDAHGGLDDSDVADLSSRLDSLNDQLSSAAD